MIHIIQAGKAELDLANIMWYKETPSSPGLYLIRYSSMAFYVAFFSTYNRWEVFHHEKGTYAGWDGAHKDICWAHLPKDMLVIFTGDVE